METAPRGSNTILAKEMKTVACRDVGIDHDGLCHVIVPADIDSSKYVEILVRAFGKDASATMEEFLEILDARANMGEILLDKGRRIE